MKIPTDAAEQSLDFDALGRRLARLEGEELCVAIAYVHDGQSAVVLGGIEGVAHLISEPELDGLLEHFGGYSLPPGAVREGERAHMLQVGELMLALSSEEFRGASDVESHLNFQVGPVLFNVAVRGGAGNA